MLNTIPSLTSMGIECIGEVSRNDSRELSLHQRSQSVSSVVEGRGGTNNARYEQRYTV